MRISYGSSDVCSSDLPIQVATVDLRHDFRRVDRTAVDHQLAGEMVAPRLHRFQPHQQPGLGLRLGALQLGGLKLGRRRLRSEEHTSELQSLMRISYAVFCLKNNKTTKNTKLSSAVT